MNILDYGCGRLRNSLYLVEAGFKNVSILDSKKQISNNKSENLLKFKNVYNIQDYKPKVSFDVVLCSFVLNVIYDYKERVEVIDSIYKSLKENGYLILEVRSKDSLRGSIFMEEYKDGYIMGNGKIRTFQKPYTKDSLIEFIQKESKFKIKTIKKNSGTILCILEK